MSRRFKKTPVGFCPHAATFNLSGALTHITTLDLADYLAPAIAMKTNHCNEAGDRHIRDCHRVGRLSHHGLTNLDEISQRARLAKRVIQQYVELLPEKIRRGQAREKNA